VSEETKTAITGFAKQFISYTEAKNALLKRIAKGKIFTLEYTNNRGVNAPDLSNINFIAATGMGARIDLTANGSFTFYNKQPLAATPGGLRPGRVRDFQFAGQVAIPFKVGDGQFDFWFSGRYERLMENASTLAGTTIPGTKGDIAVGQIGLNIPIKSLGIKFPVSVTFANRTELIKEKEVRGNIGFTFNRGAMAGKPGLTPTLTGGSADPRALVNAIHFKAAWNDPFPEKATADAPFSVEPGRDVTVRMMAATRSYALRDDAEAQVVELPYRDRMASLVVVLPKARDGLDALVASLTPARLAELTARGQSVRVALKLPRFTFTTAFEATPLLRRLGMVDPCDPVTADFSGITLSKKDRPFIGQVLHKAFVAVDEKGTEAAAATVVLVRAGSAAKPEEPVVVTVDHPFLFFIRHEATGQLLFAGRVDDPTAK
jgi:hypothetical protein